MFECFTKEQAKILVCAKVEFDKAWKKLGADCGFKHIHQVSSWSHHLQYELLTKCPGSLVRFFVVENKNKQIIALEGRGLFENVLEMQEKMGESYSFEIFLEVKNET